MPRIEIGLGSSFDLELPEFQSDPLIEAELQSDPTYLEMATEGWEESEEEAKTIPAAEEDAWDAPELPSKTQILCELQGFYYPNLIGLMPVQRSAKLTLGGGESDAGSAGFAQAS